MNKPNIASNIFLTMLFLLINNSIFSEDSQRNEMLSQLPPDQRNSIMEKMDEASKLSDEIDEAFENPNTLIERPEIKDVDTDCKNCIFGYDFFKFSPSTFAPTDNISIASDYVLGPGDKLQINFYGNESDSYEGYLTREGVFNTSLLGPINLLGLTFSDAKDLISDITETTLIGTKSFLTLTELRSISVYLLGQAYKPGKYTMSGLSTVSNALFISGGVNKEGSLRRIEVKRSNKTISQYDFYDFLLKGSLTSDVRLQDGDIIFIPFIENRVKLGGSFKKPSVYEFLEGENFNDLLQFAGGLKADVLNPVIEISSIDRVQAKRKLSYLNLSENYEDFLIQDGDLINVSSTSGLEAETIIISGQVKYPGEYAIQSGDTILDILSRAGGYTEDSYVEGSIYLRESVAKEQKKGFDRTADELERTLVNIVSAGDIGNLTEYSFAPINTLIDRLRDMDPPGRQVVDLEYLSLKKDPYKNFEVQDGDTLFYSRKTKFDIYFR
ncbi:SLBB domain-containing protein [Gammaproteobacteria bacterium]|nr:SLBB domain-containing protein [Gammaproteobacteria bacterium]